jgi:hypothetical protein
MSVALVVITNRGFLYLPRMLRTLPKYPFSHRVVVDDGGGLQPYDFDGFDFLGRDQSAGGAASIRTAWAYLNALDDPPEYVFHVEEDFSFLCEPDLDAMASILDHDPTLANIVLKRQPVGTEGPAGYVGDNPSAYVLAPEGTHLVHRQGFWLNPCLYPVSVTKLGWPSHGHEHDFTAKALAAGYRFAVLGTHEDAPHVQHIGEERARAWTW